MPTELLFAEAINMEAAFVTTLVLVFLIRVSRWTSKFLREEANQYKKILKAATNLSVITPIILLPTQTTILTYAVITLVYVMIPKQKTLTLLTANAYLLSQALVLPALFVPLSLFSHFTQRKNNAKSSHYIFFVLLTATLLLLF